MNRYEAFVILAHFVLFWSVVSPGGYNSIASPVSFSEDFSGVYRPLSDDVEISSGLSASSRKAVIVHEEVHRSQYNSLPFEESPVFLYYFFTVSAMAGGLAMFYSLYDFNWKRYFAGGFFFLGLPALLEIHAYSYSFLVTGYPGQLSLAIDYSLPVLALVMVTVMMQDAKLDKNELPLDHTA